MTGIINTGSLLRTNISTEHLVGMNGLSYTNGAKIVALEVTSALALGVGRLLPLHARIQLVAYCIDYGVCVW